MERVARRVLETGVARRVVVATDHDGIADAARRAGADVWRDDHPHRTGTDRVAAAMEALAPDADVVLNVQGDEAMVDREVLERAVEALSGNAMGTVAVPLHGDDRRLADDPDTAKVRLDAHGRRAVDFSRRTPGSGVAVLAHVGVYSFTPASLRQFTALSTSTRERAESLEQLRILEAGLPIGVRVLAPRPLVSVNRPVDLERLEGLCQRMTAPGPPFTSTG